MFDRAKLTADLTRDEGYRPLVYDDANPSALVGPGYTLVGNPTIGVGHALNKNPFSLLQAQTILGWDIEEAASPLYVRYPWLAKLPEPAQRAAANMAFNLGIGGLSKFTTFLALLEAEKYAEAADDLKPTPWASQVGPRAVRIEALIRGAGS